MSKTNPLGIIEAIFKEQGELFKQYPELKEYQKKIAKQVEEMEGTPFEKAILAHKLLAEALENEFFPHLDKQRKKNKRASTKKKAS